MSDHDCQHCGRHTSGTLCAQCTGLLAKTLRELPSYLRELETAVTRQDRVESLSTRVYGRKPPVDVASVEHAAIPPRLRSSHGRITLPATPWAFSPDAAELLRAARQDLVLWVRNVSHARGVIVDQASKLCGWLLEHRSEIAQYELAGELLDNVTWHRNRIASAIDRYAADVFLGQCDAAYVACGEQLYAHAGDKDVTCPQCGWLYSVPRRKSRLLAKVHDEIRPIRDVANAVTGLLTDERGEPVECTSSMIRSFAAKGRVAYRGMAPDGRSQLVRVGDVVDLLQDRMERDRVRRAKPRKVSA